MKPDRKKQSQEHLGQCWTSGVCSRLENVQNVPQEFSKKHLLQRYFSVSEPSKYFPPASASQESFRLKIFTTKHQNRVHQSSSWFLV